MLSINLEENAINDLDTITDVLQKVFLNRIVDIEVRMQSEEQLWIKIKNTQYMTIEETLNIISKCLNNIETHPISRIRISMFVIGNGNILSWDRYLGIKDNKFVPDRLNLLADSASSISLYSQKLNSAIVLSGVVIIELIVALFAQRS